MRPNPGKFESQSGYFGTSLLVTPLSTIVDESGFGCWRGLWVSFFSRKLLGTDELLGKHVVTQAVCDCAEYIESAYQN